MNGGWEEGTTFRSHGVPQHREDRLGTGPGWGPGAFRQFTGDWEPARGSSSDIARHRRAFPAGAEGESARGGGEIQVGAGGGGVLSSARPRLCVCMCLTVRECVRFHLN